MPCSNPWQEMTRLSGQKVREERKHFIRSHQLVYQQNRYEMSFFWLVFPVSKPIRLNSSKWINKTPNYAIPLQKFSYFVIWSLKDYFIKVYLFSKWAKFFLCVLWIKAGFLFYSSDIISRFAKLISVDRTFFQHLMNSSLWKI